VGFIITLQKAALLDGDVFSEMYFLSIDVDQQFIVTVCLNDDARSLDFFYILNRNEN